MFVCNEDANNRVELNTDGLGTTPERFDAETRIDEESAALGL